MEAWFKKLYDEVFFLLRHLHLFKELGDIIDKNNRLKSMDQAVLSWMRKSFTVDLVVGIARICDTSKGTKSLVKFLSDLKKNRQYLTRKRYVALYKDSPFDKSYANRHFDDIAGKGNNSYPIKLIDEDIEKLTKGNPCKKIMDFRHQYIVHIARNKAPLPSEKDLFSASEVIEKIMKKYNRLLTTHPESFPHDRIKQSGWQEVFTIPWIDMNAQHISEPETS